MKNKNNAFKLKSTKLTMSKNIWVRLLLFLGFTIPFILSFPVWLSKRDFPVTPFIFKPLEFDFYVDITLLLLLLLSAIWFVIKEKGRGGLYFFILYALLSILDQTRIQPFFFEIAILVFLYYLFRNDFERFKVALLLLMAGTYIWSGLHKANPTFYELWLGGLNKRIPFIPLSLRQIITWVVPFLEMSFGVFLLFNKTRKYGIILLAIMHSMVLITLTIAGAGFTVVPLNILNVLLLFMLCYKMDWNITKLVSSDIKIIIVAFYALLLPSLNLVGLYDHLLSFSYFSGKPSYCNIVFSNKEDISKLPQKIVDITKVYKGNYYINLNEWSVKYVNVLCYPEDRVYLSLQDYIETFTGNNSTTLQYYKK